MQTFYYLVRKNPSDSSKLQYFLGNLEWAGMDVDRIRLRLYSNRSLAEVMQNHYPEAEILETQIAVL